MSSVCKENTYAGITLNYRFFALTHLSKLLLPDKLFVVPMLTLRAKFLPNKDLNLGFQPYALVYFHLCHPDEALEPG